MIKILISKINYMWCSNISKKVMSYLIVLDAHSPSDARVRGSMANFEEFARAYKCPVGSNMNRSDKCLLWG